MNVPYYLFAFGAVFCGLMITVCIIRVHRSKEKAYYISGLISGLVALACISALFLQFTLLMVFFAIAFIISVAGFSTVRAAARREADKQQRETNVTEPLKARDILNLKVWYKLAFRWGVRKTMSLYILLSYSITALMFFVVYIMGLTLISAYIATSIVVTIFIVQFYQQFKKNNLNPQESTKHASLPEPPA